MTQATKVYLAARYSRIEEMNAYADQLREAGCEVTSRWLLGIHQLHEGAEPVDAHAPSVPLEARPFAQDDFDDVLRSHVVVCFTESPGTQGAGRGGRHVEFGMALAWGKDLVIVGPRENVFHTLPQVQRFSRWDPSVIRAVTDDITKENLKVLRMINERRQFLFHVGVNTSHDDPVGVAPSYHAAAQRATKKGLLIEVGNRYTITEEGWLHIEPS